jgi:hypothetical protein
LCGIREFCTLPKKEFTASINAATLTLFRSTYLDDAKMVPPEKRAQIIAALKANPNANAVARQVGGVSNVTVAKIAKQIGIDLAAGKTVNSLPPEKFAAHSEVCFCFPT